MDGVLQMVYPDGVPQASSDSTSGASNMAKPVTTSDSLARFAAFSLALVTLPGFTFYVCKTRIAWVDGNATFSGAMAALVANILLLMYLCIIMFEDSLSERQRRPATGPAIPAKSPAVGVNQQAQLPLPETKKDK